MIGILHTACGVVALLLGAAIFVRAKGTRSHIWLGRLYLASMVCLNLTALCVYRLTGGFNMFHILAIVNLAMIAVGVIHILRRRHMRNWLWRHYHYMAWSYVALLAASVNEALVRIPFLSQLNTTMNPWLTVVAMSVLLGLSALVIFLRQKGMLSRYGTGD